MQRKRRLAREAVPLALSSSRAVSCSLRATSGFAAMSPALILHAERAHMVQSLCPFSGRDSTRVRGHASLRVCSASMPACRRLVASFPGHSVARTQVPTCSHSIVPLSPSLAVLCLHAKCCLAAEMRPPPLDCLLRRRRRLAFPLPRATPAPIGLKLTPSGAPKRWIADAPSGRRRRRRARG